MPCDFQNSTTAAHDGGDVVDPAAAHADSDACAGPKPGFEPCLRQLLRHGSRNVLQGPVREILTNQQQRRKIHLRII